MKSLFAPGQNATSPPETLVNPSSQLHTPVCTAATQATLGTGLCERACLFVIGGGRGEARGGGVGGSACMRVDTDNRYYS